MNTIAHVAVVVPAANEQDTVGACLRALQASARLLESRRPAISVDLLVVLDTCSDDTARIVAAAGVDAVETRARNVGAARDLGSRTIVARAPVAPGHTWTAHTDADSTVAPHWLLEHVRRAESGADLVLGTVEPDLEEPALTRWRGFHHDADGHPHVHAANLGIRADVLDLLGGWPRRRAHEDVALVARATAAGRSIARVGGLAVRTSARRRGRAPAGLSSYLRELDRMPTAIRGG